MDISRWVTRWACLCSARWSPWPFRLDQVSTVQACCLKAASSQSTLDFPPCLQHPMAPRTPAPSQGLCRWEPWGLKLIRFQLKPLNLQNDASRPGGQERGWEWGEYQSLNRKEEAAPWHRLSLEVTVLGAWPSWTVVTMLPLYLSASRSLCTPQRTNPQKGGSPQHQPAISTPFAPARRASLAACKVMPQLERHALNASVLRPS